MRREKEKSEIKIKMNRKKPAKMEGQRREV